MLDLVIPDAGPLITLGLIDRLDLLDRFNCPILVTDMVHAEVARGPDTALDKAAFQRWFAGRGNRVQVVDTLYGAMWSAVPDEKRREIKRLHPDMGEQSIREFTEKMRHVLPPDDQVLVLFEEDDVKRLSFGRHVHLLHTYAFLVAVERMGLIPSAEALHREIEARGRRIVRDLYDRHAARAAGDDVDWQDAYDRAPANDA